MGKMMWKFQKKLRNHHLPSFVPCYFHPTPFLLPLEEQLSGVLESNAADKKDKKRIPEGNFMGFLQVWFSPHFRPSLSWKYGCLSWFPHGNSFVSPKDLCNLWLFQNDSLGKKMRLQLALFDWLPRPRGPWERSAGCRPFSLQSAAMSPKCPIFGAVSRLPRVPAPSPANHPKKVRTFLRT